MEDLVAALGTILEAAWTDGKALATVDGREYREVSVVVRRAGGLGEPELYSSVQNWGTTPAGRVGNLEREVQALTARLRATQEALDGVKAELAQKAPDPEPMPLQGPELWDPDAEPGYDPEPSTCPLCDFVAQNRAGLRAHLRRSHGDKRSPEDIRATL